MRFPLGEKLRPVRLNAEPEAGAGGAGFPGLGGGGLSWAGLSGSASFFSVDFFSVGFFSAGGAGSGPCSEGSSCAFLSPVTAAGCLKIAGGSGDRRYVNDSASKW